MFSQQELTANNTTNELLPRDKFQHLVVQSMATLESIMNNEEIPASERASIALKILEMAGGNFQNAAPQMTPLPTQTSAIVESQQLTISPRNSSYTTLPTQTTNGVKTNKIQSDAVQQPSILIPCTNYILIDNFLTPEENEYAMQVALDKRADYTQSSTTTQANNYRKSYVLFSQNYPELSEIMQRKVVANLPEILPKINHQQFPISEIEIQLTAHNDGCFYKMHNDAGSEKTATRELSYVYYFHQEPKGFSGGELKLYDTELNGSMVITQKNFRLIEPRNNTIVFFNSRSRHEVLPVVCPSKAFEKSRFTLNGWIRREG